jgi:hypothetical protein
VLRLRFVVLVLVACEVGGADPMAVDAEAAGAEVAVDPRAAAGAEAAADPRVEDGPRAADGPGPAAWRFVVISDLHQPDGARPSPAITALVDAVIAEHPRLVVVAGDSTNGNPGDGPGRTQAIRASWRTLLAELEPLRRAGIAVLPVAGNHDAVLPGHRAAYADAFHDLERWAQPFAIEGARQPAGGAVALDAAPFSYAVRVGDVHLALAHVVDQGLEPEVARWLADDLARARGAAMRIVVGHVPMASVMNSPNPALVDALGGLLAGGGVTAYIAGHEHLAWDEVVPSPAGAIRQIVVGTGIGSYNYGPSPAARKRARCTALSVAGPGAPRFRCWLPYSQLAFALHDSFWDGDRLVQCAHQTYTVFTVDGAVLTARPVEVAPSGASVAFQPPDR